MATLNPLSYPKGKSFQCEVCGKPAVLQCTKCRVTFYCTKDHQSLDAQGIHDRICPLLAPLRAPADGIGSEEDREKRERTLLASQRALIDLTRNEASKFLVHRQCELAIPGALQALRFSIKVYGEGHINVVPAYLLLAEANLGLGRYQQVEEFLSMANWSVVKNPDCSNSLRSKLYRNFGKLAAARGEHDKALDYLAKDVYHSSLDLGPEHIEAAGGYYHMAGVFTAQGNVDNALAFYDKVVDVWYKFLVSVRNTGSADVSTMSESQLAEAKAILEHIATARTEFLGANHIATGEVKYTQGLLNLFCGDGDAAGAGLRTALDIYTEHLGPDHPSTNDVRIVLGELSDGAALGTA